MIELKTEILKVFNPYNSTDEDLICTFEIHRDKKGKADGVTLITIVSEAGDNLMDYLEPDNIPYYLEEKFMENL